MILVRAPRRRRAFTLFEVILAIAMSVVLISALYLALDMHFRLARSGREIIDETALTRFVVQRITQDIDCQLSAIDPRLQGNKNKSGGGSSASGASPTSASPSSSPSSSASSSSASSSSSSSSSGSSSSNNTVVFNLGVFGDSNHLVLTGRGVPKDLTQPPQSAPSQTSDLRRVTYWLMGDGNQGSGLARQEIRLVTGTDVTASSPPALPPAVGNPESYIIAREVTKFSLEYYDGKSWQSSWDGSSTDPTTGYPIGPPMAIAFTITLQLPDHGRNKGKEVTYRHVVAIAAANNQGQTPTQPQNQSGSP